MLIRRPPREIISPFVINCQAGRLVTDLHRAAMRRSRGLVVPAPAFKRRRSKINSCQMATECVLNVRVCVVVVVVVVPFVVVFSCVWLCCGVFWLFIYLFFLFFFFFFLLGGGGVCFDVCCCSCVCVFIRVFSWFLFTVSLFAWVVVVFVVFLGCVGFVLFLCFSCGLFLGAGGCLFVFVFVLINTRRLNVLK